MLGKERSLSITLVLSVLNFKMMNKKLIIFIASISLLSACQQEETITPREYPFVESIDISSIDETGAFINFEVLKEGRAAIESYGVEYLESSAFDNIYLPKEYLVLETQGVPSGNMISYKLKYDLEKGIEYYVKPFVRSNGKTVFGLPMVFDSKGVKGPEISEVSINQITGNTRFTIKGDYFSSIKEKNFVHIPYIDEFFSVQVVEATYQELTVELVRNNMPMTVLDGSYELIITVMDKSTTLPGHFTFGYPNIESISKLSAHVGEEITVTIDKEYEYDLKLVYGDFPNGYYGFINLDKIGPTTYKGKVSNYIAGKYDLKLVGPDFLIVYPQKFELKDSWQLMTDFIQLNDWQDFQLIPVGNKLVFWKNDYSKSYFWDPLTQGITELPAFPGAKLGRGNLELYGNSDEEFFVGFGFKYLGSGYGIETYVDLWKLDLNSMTWNQMDDIPAANGLLYRFFEYQNKIMAISGIEKKYLILDPKLGTWQKSSFDVPEFVKNYTKMWVHQDYIYYFQENTSYLVIRRFKPGSAPELFGEFPTISAGGIKGMKIIGNTFYLTSYGQNLSINMMTKEVTNYQSIFYFGNGLSISEYWGEIESKPYTFPITNQNQYHLFRIYQLSTEN